MAKRPGISVNVVTLGCSKNLVDSERVLSQLSAAGFKAYHQTDKPTDVVIVNTCGFIGDAKEESINTILEFAQAKQQGSLKALYVMGCLSQRYCKELPDELPEVDAFFGKFDWENVVGTIASRFNMPNVGTDSHKYERAITTGPRMAYLKIAEGCNRFCAFCAIPLITGRFTSRPIDEIEAEVRHLVSQGIVEFNIIAQDLSSYGLDIYGRHALAELVESLAQVPGVRWLRLHYAYPSDFPLDVLDVMAKHPNVCSYLDIALQHISDRVLTNMRRHITAAQTMELLEKIRAKVPGIHLRTTLMVGFPGEEKEDFEQLLEFVRSQRFERLGAFAYCEEEGTYGAQHLVDSIPDDVKQERLSRLMALQEEISLELQQQKVGQILEVKIDREEAEYYVGRTQWDSPEVDPEVLIRKQRVLKPGEFYNVKILEALPFELIGEPC